MHDFIVNVEIIVARGDRFLTIVRSDDEEHGGGWLCFPGGKLDHGDPERDALEQTASRELMEEVGLAADPGTVRYVESHTFQAGDQLVLDVVVMTDAADGEPSVQDPSEVADILWLTAGEIMSDARVQDFTRQSLRRALEHA